MPAVSEKQARFMRACVHNPESMKGKCPPKSVAREFMHTSDDAKKKKKKKHDDPYD